jgi:hypothetical protein
MAAHANCFEESIAQYPLGLQGARAKKLDRSVFLDNRI